MASGAMSTSTSLSSLEAIFKPYRVLLLGDARVFSSLATKYADSAVQGRRCVDDRCVSFRAHVNGVPRTLDVQLCSSRDDPLFVLCCAWAHASVVVCDHDEKANDAERMVDAVTQLYYSAILRDKRAVIASSLDDSLRCPVIVMGACAVAKEIAAREDMPLVTSVADDNLVPFAVGMVDLARPNLYYDSFLDHRQRLVEWLGATARDAKELLQLNNALKGFGCKGALDLYLAAGTAHLTAAHDFEFVAHAVHEHFVRQTAFPYMVPLLLRQHLHEGSAMAAGGREMSLLSIQEECLRILYPHVVHMPDSPLPRVALPSAAVVMEEPTSPASPDTVMVREMKLPHRRKSASVRVTSAASLFQRGPHSSTSTSHGSVSGSQGDSEVTTPSPGSSATSSTRSTPTNSPPRSRDMSSPVLPFPKARSNSTSPSKTKQESVASSSRLISEYTSKSGSPSSSKAESLFKMVGKSPESPSSSSRSVSPSTKGDFFPSIKIRAPSDPTNKMSPRAADVEGGAVDVAGLQQRNSTGRLPTSATLYDSSKAVVKKQVGSQKAISGVRAHSFSALPKLSGSSSPRGSGGVLSPRGLLAAREKESPRNSRSRLLVPHKDSSLTALEHNVVLEAGTRWSVLETMLSEAIKEEEGPKRQEALFVWESLERVLGVHLLQGRFAAWLCANEVLRTPDLTRVFREDSVATRWLHRTFQAEAKRPLIAALQPSVRNIIAATPTLSLTDMDVASVEALLQPFFAALFGETLSLGLLGPLTRIRDLVGDDWAILGRLVMLRWIGPMLMQSDHFTVTEKAVGPTQSQRSSLLMLSKMCIVLGENTIDKLEPDSPLARYRPFLEDLSSDFVNFLRRQVSEDSMAAALKEVAVAELVRARKKRAFQVYLETLRVALQAVRCDESWLA